MQGLYDKVASGGPLELGGIQIRLSEPGRLVCVPRLPKGERRQLLCQLLEVLPRSANDRDAKLEALRRAVGVRVDLEQALDEIDDPRFYVAGPAFGGACAVLGEFPVIYMGSVQARLGVLTPLGWLAEVDTVCQSLRALEGMVVMRLISMGARVEMAKELLSDPTRGAELKALAELWRAGRHVRVP